MEEMHHDSYAKRSMGSQSSHGVFALTKRRSEEAGARGGVATFICRWMCSNFSPSRYVMGFQFWPFTLIWGE